MPSHNNSDHALEEAEEKLRALKDGLAEKRKTMRPGECPGCGAFRLDGQPPQIHEHDCVLTNLSDRSVRG